MSTDRHNITFKRGNIFDSDAQVLTNTVNTVGVMGAGLAKQFRQYFPEMFEDYRRRCRHGQVKVGRPYLWTPPNGEGKWVLNFPTKHHWKGKSRLEWIEEGLRHLLAHYKEWGIQSLAMPALGCDLGGLRWERVKPLMVRYLSQMDIPVEIYEPLPKRRFAAMKFHIRDETLADEGLKQIEWADWQMPVLQKIRERFEREKPLEGVRIGACLHVTKETANLMRTLMAGGAQVAVCASNPLSTQDEVAAALVKHFGVPVFAVRGEDTETYYKHIHAVLDIHPEVTMDDGADLVSTLHKERRSQLLEVKGGTEETTTGVIRLRSMARDGVLAYPIVAVNDAYTKFLFDNRYGTGQSAIDGILRATNFLLAGSTVVVAGYGWCGRGIAMRARGMGARVIVTEVNPLRALEAVMDGYEVMPIAEAAEKGNVFVTATGDVSVITTEHMLRMKDGAILCNAGHFDVEVDVKGLRQIAVKHRRLRANLDEFTLPNGKRIFLLAEGRLVNLASAEGHPAAVMDMSFANQALSVAYIVQHAGELTRDVHPVPRELDEEVARLKLESMGIRIDTLTPEQQRYLSSWEEGTE